ncbi:OmpA family protein [Mesorhizobium sp. KR9-304]|uniref:OmpA family protein n=1 Tax=Mesorhizobium sp. KR9-304 TaxID=3156614 RepID=UPI0032B4013E
MKRQPRILAGTALGLLMASAPLGAYPLQSGEALDFSQRVKNAPLTLAQAECAEGESAEACAQRLQSEQPAPQAEEPRPAPEPEAAPEPAPEPEAAPEPAPEPEAAPEPAPEPEAAPAPADEAPAPEKPASEAEPSPQPEAAPAPAEQPVAPAPEKPAAEQPAPEAPAAEPAPREAPAEQPATQQPAPEAPATEPVQPAPEAPATGEQPAQSGEAPVDPNAPALDPNAAPILDSQKEAPPAGAAQPGEQAARPAPAPVDQGPPPESDAASQVAPIAPDQIQSVTTEQGERLEVGTTREERQRNRRERRERRDDVQVVEEFNDNRVIIEINNQTYIESPDYERMIRDRDEVYYEELPRGRVREVITRPNGVRIVTIRDRYGDVIRRSRIEPDNREVILVYVEDRYYDDAREWRDPGLDLPPMRLSIPREEYILEAEFVEDEDSYYEFLEQPPVERVERTYSLNDVKRSARIRDKVRRIDLDTLTFEFGSASIPESEVPKLEGVADAMAKLLAKNPAETFLLEGHTDAVGSDLANLALSDKRAEAVAEALTNVFGIPPENLATQGYGEQYLKVKTEERERENRRVAIRRVTALVSPVASAN